MEFKQISLEKQLDTALELAVKYHKHQRDKQGRNYILHPLSVMMKMDTLQEKITAVLHDICEDTTITISELRKYNFSEEIIVAIDYLTRKKDDTYFDYIQEIKNCKLAIKVKLVDLEDNLREGCPDTLRKRYEKAKSILLK